MVGGVEEYDADDEAYECSKERVVDAYHSFEYIETVPYTTPYEHEANDDINIPDEIGWAGCIFFHLSSITKTAHRGGFCESSGDAES